MCPPSSSKPPIVSKTALSFPRYRRNLFFPYISIPDAAVNYRLYDGGISLDKEQLIKLAEELYQEALDANAYFLIMQQYREMQKEYLSEVSEL